MSETKDWADEIGRDFTTRAVGIPIWETEIAAELRKAFLRGRIAGLREASNYAREMVPEGDNEIQIAAYFEVSGELHDLANSLET